MQCSVNIDRSNSVLRGLLCLAVLVLAGLMISGLEGCGKESSTAPSGSGTVVITTEPTGLEAPWSVTGTEGYTASGARATTLPSVPCGEYTVTWGDVPNKVTPADSTQTLVDGDTIAFIGVYSNPTGTVRDVDGNVYKTIKIGNQWWMMESLKVTHYRNGDPIPYVTDSLTWGDLTSGAYCNYENDSNNVATYGRLYNWYAVDDSCNIAPEGWHVPTDAEWQVLADYLGADPGGKLKEAGTTHWADPNTGATNESGFSALPVGCRRNDGSFYGMGSYAYFWSSTGRDYYAWRRSLHYDNSQVHRFGDFKECGFSVRCVKDSI